MLSSVARPVPVVVVIPLVRRCAVHSLSCMVVLASACLRPESTRLVPTALKRVLGAALLGCAFGLDFGLVFKHNV